MPSAQHIANLAAAKKKKLPGLPVPKPVVQPIAKSIVAKPVAKPVAPNQIMAQKMAAANPGVGAPRPLAAANNYADKNNLNPAQRTQLQQSTGYRNLSNEGRTPSKAFQDVIDGKTPMNRSLLDQFPPSLQPPKSAQQLQQEKLQTAQEQESKGVRELRKGASGMDSALAGQNKFIQEGRDLNMQAINEGSDRTLGLLGSQKQELQDQTGVAVNQQLAQQDTATQLNQNQKDYQRKVNEENRLVRDEDVTKTRDQMQLQLGNFARTVSSAALSTIGDFETKVARGAQLLDSQEMSQMQELDLGLKNTVDNVTNNIGQLQTGLQAAMRENDIEQTAESRNRVTQLQTAINQAQQQLQAVQVQRADAKMQNAQAIVSQFNTEEEQQIQQRGQQLQERLAYAQLNGVDPVTGQTITAEQQRQFENTIKLGEMIGEVNGQQTLAGRQQGESERTTGAGLTGIDPLTGKQTLEAQSALGFIGGQRTLQGQSLDQGAYQFGQNFNQNASQFSQSLGLQKAQFGLDAASTLGGGGQLTGFDPVTGAPQFSQGADKNQIYNQIAGGNFSITPPAQPKTLADRNNNPGNLRFNGQEGASQGQGGFASFASPEAGFAAQVADVTAKLSGNSPAVRAKLGRNAQTLQDVISVYAPAEDANNPQSYAATVANALGITPQTPVNQIDPARLAAAMAKHEGFTGKIEFAAEDFSRAKKAGDAQGYMNEVQGYQPSQQFNAAGQTAQFAGGAFPSSQPSGQSPLNQQEQQYLMGLSNSGASQEDVLSEWNKMMSSKQKTNNPADATDSQRTTSLYANRVEQANTIFDQLEGTIASMSPSAYKAAHAATGNFITNSFVSPEIQAQVQAENNFLTAVLRRESGASISPTEYSTGRAQYFPQPGDKAEALANKKALRQLVMQSLVQQSGSAYVPVDPRLLGSQGSQGVPGVGAVQDSASYQSKYKY